MQQGILPVQLAALAQLCGHRADPCNRTGGACNVSGDNGQAIDYADGPARNKATLALAVSESNTCFGMTALSTPRGTDHALIGTANTCFLQV